MNRILALQGLSPVSFSVPGDLLGGDSESGQSNDCSSATTRCSTTSTGCRPPNNLCW